MDTYSKKIFMIIRDQIMIKIGFQLITNKKMNLSYMLIEKAVKTYKSHRSALDFGTMKFTQSIKENRTTDYYYVCKLGKVVVNIG